jgi:hypothetical protein
MIEFSETDDRLELVYEAEFGPSGWINEELEKSGEVKIARTFFFSKDDLVNKPDASDEDSGGPYTFTLGSRNGDYFKIDGDKLGIDHDLYLASDMRLETGTFIAPRNISIFRKIARVTAEDIYIGGSQPSAMPIADFKGLLRSFPNSTELDHYVNAKVARIVRDYFETTTPADRKFEEFLSRRGKEPKVHDLPDLYQLEASKYEFIRDKIVELLKDEKSFSENEWRDLMLQFILLIFPKYVCVLRNVLVKDFYTAAKQPKNRYLDIALLDANGHIDIIEIKKPFENCLVSESNYRGNFTPRKELSGTIMQAEKYLFHLSKWAKIGWRAGWRSFAMRRFTSNSSWMDASTIRCGKGRLRLILRSTGLNSCGPNVWAICRDRWSIDAILARSFVNMSLQHIKSPSRFPSPALAIAINLPMTRAGANWTLSMHIGQVASKGFRHIAIQWTGAARWRRFRAANAARKIFV